MKYIYRCEPCNRDYVEIRQLTESQFVTHCGCGEVFTLIREEEIK